MSRPIRAAILAALLPGATLAQELTDLSCFRRIYDPAHMAANPNQTVETLEIVFGTEGGAFGVARATATFRDDPGIYSNFLICGQRPGWPKTCGVECDGGMMTAEPSGGRLRVTSSGFIVSGSCGEPAIDGEDPPFRWVGDTPQGTETVFLLDPVDPAGCPAIYQTE